MPQRAFNAYAMNPISAQKLFAWAMLFMSLLPFTLSAQPDTLFSHTLFKHTSVAFRPGVYTDGLTWGKGDTVRTANGRIVLHKVRLPRLPHHITATLDVHLTSAGDPWDKYGAVFVLPAHQEVDLLTISRGGSYPMADTMRVGNLRGAVPAKGYVPTVELMRFMTPFGVGHYSTLGDSIQRSQRTPVYIDSFASEVSWTTDISDRLPLFTDSVWVGVYIDTWTSTGYTLTANLHVVRGSTSGVCGRRAIMPLLNTTPYLGQPIPDVFARQVVQLPFSLPRGAKRVQLRLITTGHGGHSGGDEFVPREHLIYLVQGADTTLLASFTPWRNDCAAFRRFNPSTGVWLRSRDIAHIGAEGRAVTPIQEGIASSDLSRSNWCPGSHVEPLLLPIHKLRTGQPYTILIAIPEAQPAMQDLLNHWLVSAWLTWET